MAQRMGSGQCVSTGARVWRSGLAILLGATIWVGSLQAVAVVPAWPLNDTGIDWWADYSTSFLPAEPSHFPGQDASYGRDATHHDDTDGHAGFSFTKLSATGAALPASATAWSCVRDNVTGLVWEIKTDDGGLRDRSWTYTWYEPDDTRNGGFAGYENSGSCGGEISCDTHGYVLAVNQAGLCGARDWRLPNQQELKSIVDNSRIGPAIDTRYFPAETGLGYLEYWSSSPRADYSDNAWFLSIYNRDLVAFYDGYNSKGAAYHVQLVRGGQALSFDPPPPSATLGPAGGPANPSGSAADPVNTATGNYYYIHDDLTLPGRGIGLTFTRTYNAQDATDGPFGRGWTHSYLFRLTENADGSVVIRHGDGHDSFFDLVSDGTYSSRYPGVQERLTKTAAGQFQLTSRDRTTHSFVEGRLTQISDRNGNAVGLSYNGAGALTTLSDPVGRLVTLTYDGNGRLTQLTGPLNRTVRYAYDANGLLVSDTDPDGAIQRYSYNADRLLQRMTNRRGQVLVDNLYDAAGRVVSQTNGRGHLMRFAYNTPNLGDTTITNALDEATIHRHDGLGRLIAEIGPMGHSLQYAYDNDNNRSQATDRNGRVTRYTYDARGNVLTQTDPLNGVTTLTYNADNQPLTRVDALGQTTRYAYDARGNLLSETDALNQVTRYTYDSTGQRLTRTDANGHVTTYGYDSQGNRIAVTDPLGHVTATDYDAAGRPVRVTDANGKATVLTYDGSNRLLTSTDALGQVIAFGYDADGNRTRVTDAKGKATTTAYDANDNVTGVTDPTGAVTEATYDAANQRLTQSDARGNVTRFVYDAGHRMIRKTDALGQSTHYSYDANGNLLSETNPLGKASTLVYDALNRLVRTTDPLNQATLYEYDVLGRRTGMTDAEGRKTTYRYDALDRLERVTDPAGTTSDITYDPVGNRLTLVNPKGQITRYSYDAADRRTGETDPLGKVTAWQYDRVGNLVRRTDAKGQVTDYTYDGANRLTGIRYADATTVSFTRDANGNITRMVDRLGTTTSVYDALNRLTEQTDPYGAKVTHGYDQTGNRTGLTYPDGKEVTYGYDALNRMVTVTDWLGNRTAYSYDGAGNLSGRVNASGAEAIYDYDVANRLVGVTEEGAGVTTVASQRLTLDAVGNRTAIDSADAIAPRYTGQDTAAAFNDADHLTNLGGSAVTHDANGNLLTQPGGTYQYDADDRLIAANGQTYVYDGQGRRLAATRGGVTTRYVVDTVAPLSQVIMERNTAGGAIAYYVHGIGLISRSTASGDISNYHYDANGNTVALTNATAQVTDAYAYSPFGEPLAQQGSTPNPFRFLGQFGIQHEGNGLHYVRARYYHPATGRFINKDPLSGSAGNGQTLNRYAYALNNPVRFVDVNGLSAREGMLARNELGSSDVLNQRVLSRESTARELGADKNSGWLSPCSIDDQVSVYAACESAFADALAKPIGVVKIIAGLSAGAGVVVLGAAIATGAVAVGTATAAGAAFVQLSAGVFGASSSIIGGIGEVSGWKPEVIGGMEQVGGVASIVNVFTSRNLLELILNLTQASVDNL